MRFSFAKYQGLGNDFIVLDARQWPESQIGPELARRLCDRHRSIGGDGILWVALDEKKNAARMVIYNRDGSRPEMCGNGVRCAAAYFADRQETRDRASLEVLSDAGPRPLTFQPGYDGGWLVTVEMGSIIAEPQGFTTVDLAGTPTLVHFGDAGNPHAVLFVDGPGALDEIEDDLPPRRAAREAAATLVRAREDRYPQGTNVEFVAQKQDGSLRVRVHERGVGWTLACGTGACAVAAVQYARKGVHEGTQRVELDGGALSVALRREPSGAYHAWMTGPAGRAFRGTVEESELVR
jgi:diaminopimelate epimerase